MSTLYVLLLKSAQRTYSFNHAIVATGSRQSIKGFKFGGRVIIQLVV